MTEYVPGTVNFNAQMVADYYERQAWADACYDKQFAEELERPGSSRFDPHYPRAPWPAPVRIRRRQRWYVCSRPCCGRESSVAVYTDMEGVRKPTHDVRACAFCEVAWSVTSGTICEPATETYEQQREDEAWNALPSPVLKPF